MDTRSSTDNQHKATQMARQAVPYTRAPGWEVGLKTSPDSAHQAICSGMELDLQGERAVFF